MKGDHVRILPAASPTWGGMVGTIDYYNHKHAWIALDGAKDLLSFERHEYEVISEAEWEEARPEEGEPK